MKRMLVAALAVMMLGACSSDAAVVSDMKAWDLRGRAKAVVAVTNAIQDGLR